MAGSNLERLPTSFPEVVRLRPRVFRDDRGYFFEPYNREALRSVGIDLPFVMDGESLSHRGTVRGLHFRVPGESKLVRCSLGAIWDVVVDVRPGSPTLGRWQAYELSAENFEQLLIPPGFAHGFLALRQLTVIHYKKTEHYEPSCERSIRWDDPEIGITWPETVTLVSDRDRTAPLLKEWLERNER